MRISSRILLGLAIALTMVSLHAATLDEANAAFAAGHYDESTRDFQSVIDQKGYSAPVLFNLGNSYFREGNLPQAILSYKRAQWLAPADLEIEANLQYAQKQAGLKTTDQAWWEKYTSFFNSSGWTWLASATWILLCLYNLAWWLWPRARGLMALPGFACAILFVISIASIVITAGKLNQSVVTAKDATVLLSPFATAQTVFSPAPGETLKVRKSYHEFLKVTDDAGRKGWIAKNQVTKVIEK